MAVVLSALFVLVDALPSDYAGRVAGANATRAEQLRASYGLDAPVTVRLVRWWAGIARGDAGVSFVDAHPVLPKVAHRFMMTAAIGVPAMLIAVTAAVVVAFALAWLDHTLPGTWLSVAVSVIVGLPEVVLIIALVLLGAVWLGWVPPVSLVNPAIPLWRQPTILLLPVTALAVPHAAWGARMLRGSAADVISGDLVASARRRGVGVWRIAVHHVLPRWRGPIIQVSAMLAAGIIGGSVVVEALLAYPGLGQLLASAVANRDTPTVQAAGAAVVAVSLALLTAADYAATRAEES